MNSFLVKLVYQITCGNGKHTPQFDEQVRFLTANTEAEAVEKSIAIGWQEEEVFYNRNSQLVKWKFIAVTEVHAMTDLSDGAEVYSQIKETEDAFSYIRFAQHKAERLLSKEELTHL